MKKLTIIALALITLGATSQIVEKNIDKEEVKTVVTTNLKENASENESIYFQHEDDKQGSLIEKSQLEKSVEAILDAFAIISIMDKYGLTYVGTESLHERWSLPVMNVTARSKPNPKPECGTEPYLRKSKYQLYSSSDKPNSATFSFK